VLEMEVKVGETTSRLKMLEEAVFLTNNEKGRSIFDDFADRLSEMHIYLGKKTHELVEQRDALLSKIEERMFSMDAKIDIAIKIGEDMEICTEEVSKLKKSVAKMNKMAVDTIQLAKRDLTNEITVNSR
jgi:polyhydroxyalkanoate synthesis regulator phasin